MTKKVVNMEVIAADFSDETAIMLAKAWVLLATADMIMAVTSYIDLFEITGIEIPQAETDWHHSRSLEWVNRAALDFLRNVIPLGLDLNNPQGDDIIEELVEWYRKEAYATKSVATLKDEANIFIAEYHNNQEEKE